MRRHGAGRAQGQPITAGAVQADVDECELATDRAAGRVGVAVSVCSHSYLLSIAANNATAAPLMVISPSGLNHDATEKLSQPRLTVPPCWIAMRDFFALPNMARGLVWQSPCTGSNPATGRSAAGSQQLPWHVAPRLAQ